MIVPGLDERGFFTPENIYPLLSNRFEVVKRWTLERGRKRRAFASGQTKRPAFNRTPTLKPEALELLRGHLEVDIEPGEEMYSTAHPELACCPDGLICTEPRVTIGATVVAFRNEDRLQQLAKRVRAEQFVSAQAHILATSADGWVVAGYKPGYPLIVKFVPPHEKTLLALIQRTTWAASRIKSTNSITPSYFDRLPPYYCHPPGCPPLIGYGALRQIILEAEDRIILEAS